MTVSLPPLDRPLVSVVMPVYNGSAFLGEAIASVVAQSFDGWELLIVDDGSTDDSGAIAEEYARRHPTRVRVLTHAGRVNRGMSASRNLGVARARGAFVAFLDADDVWLPHKLADQVALMRAHPEVGLLYGRTCYWYSWARGAAADGAAGDVLPDDTPALEVPTGVVIPPPTLAVRALEQTMGMPCTCSVLIRREVLQAVGGGSEQFRDAYEDQVLFLKLMLVTPTYAADAMWDLYRQHPRSSSAALERAGAAARARRRYLAWAGAYLDGHPSATPEVLAAWRRAVRKHRYPWLRPAREGARAATYRVRMLAVRARLAAGRLLRGRRGP